MYTSVYGRLCHKPVESRSVLNEHICVCLLTVKEPEGDGESSVKWMHVVAFGNVARVLQTCQEDSYIVVSGPCVTYRSLKDDGLQEFDLVVLADTVRPCDDYFRQLAFAEGRREISLIEPTQDIECSKDAISFDGDKQH